MVKLTQPRYSICTITTKDEQLVKRREEIKKKGYTDEAIYKAGIEALENKKS